MCLFSRGKKKNPNKTSLWLDSKKPFLGRLKSVLIAVLIWDCYTWTDSTMSVTICCPVNLLSINWLLRPWDSVAQCSIKAYKSETHPNHVICCKNKEQGERRRHSGTWSFHPISGKLLALAADLDNFYFKLLQYQNKQFLPLPIFSNSNNSQQIMCNYFEMRSD